MVINIVAGSFGLMWVGMTQGVPLTMMMECLGASGVLIGSIATVQQIAMLVQVPSAFYCERLASRKSFWAAIALLHRLLWFAPAVLPLVMLGKPKAAALTVVVFAAISTVLAQSVTAVWYSWMADLIPERIRGRFWGTRQSLVTLAYLVSMGIAGRILDLYPDPRQPGGSFIGYAIVFGIGAFLGCLDIIVHLWVPEPKPSRARVTVGVFSRVWPILRDPDYRWLTLSMGVWYFASGLTASFGFLYLSRQFHVTYTHLTATVISAALGTTLAGFVWGRVIDRVGARSFGVVTMLLSPVFGVVWFLMQNRSVDVPLLWGSAVSLPQPILLLVIVNVVAGASYSAVPLCQLSLSSALTRPEGRTLAMAVHWSVVGLLSAFGPVAGGFVMDWVSAHPIPLTLPSGVPFSFFHVLVVLHAAAAWLVAAPLLARVRKRRGEMPIRTLLGSPLRAISIIQNIGLLTESDSIHARARAVRELGRQKTSFAVSDLIKKLDDPSTDVREEAVLALGNIGSPDAIDALLAKLDDPNSDLGPQIARALRQARNPKTVAALVRKLADDDREVRAESARALGEIGDQRASRSLLELLQRTDDAKLVSASSEALARLGELAAIHEILPRMKSTRNPVLKRSLAVAIGDLLGEPGEFYRILVDEEENCGTQVEQMLERLRESIRNMTRELLPQEGESIVAMTREVEAAYHAGDMQKAADVLFGLSIGLAAIRFGIEFGGDAKSFVDDLVWLDQRFGIGVSYLNLLRHQWSEAQWGQRDYVDILLGVYFLASSRPRSTFSIAEAT